MIDFATVLRKMIEKYGDDSAARRATLYAAARRTIDRYIVARTMSPAEADFERQRLEQAIDAIEAAYQARANSGAVDAADFREVFARIGAAASSWTNEPPSDSLEEQAPSTAPPREAERRSWLDEPDGIAGIFSPIGNLPDGFDIREAGADEPAQVERSAPPAEELPATAGIGEVQEEPLAEMRLAPEAGPNEDEGEAEAAPHKLVAAAPSGSPDAAQPDGTQEIALSPPGGSLADAPEPADRDEARSLRADFVAFACSMLSKGLVPYDGLWIRPEERTERLSRASADAVWLTLQSGLAVAAVLSAGTLCFLLLIAVAY